VERVNSRLQEVFENGIGCGGKKDIKTEMIVPFFDEIS
jgi:hypothetical protein